MDFDEKINEMSIKVRNLKDDINTEEATKTAFIMPFIHNVLGYDIFDPSEVVPEFIADIGTKKGEKVDYALVLDGQVQMLIECKKVGSSLSLENASQLYRYFACTKARIGVLTNGQVWNFYMDLDEPNKMDERPFMVLDLLDIDKAALPELQKLSKPSFDIESIANSAESLKYLNALRRVITEELRDPSDDLVRLFAGKVYSGKFTQNALDKFRILVEKAIKRYHNELVNDRLTSALDADDNSFPDEDTIELQNDNEIVTTDEEIAGFLIVQAIGCSEVDPSRITMRDARSYCAVFLDDNNRRPIIRLEFNAKQKYITLFKERQQQERTPIDKLDDIYKYSNVIRDEIRFLINEH